VVVGGRWLVCPNCERLCRYLLRREGWKCRTCAGVGDTIRFRMRQQRSRLRVAILSEVDDVRWHDRGNESSSGSAFADGRDSGSPRSAARQAHVLILIRSSLTLPRPGLDLPFGRGRLDASVSRFTRLSQANFIGRFAPEGGPGDAWAGR
jgi:hypothetical protein